MRTLNDKRCNETGTRVSYAAGDTVSDKNSTGRLKTTELFQVLVREFRILEFERHTRTNELGAVQRLVLHTFTHRVFDALRGAPSNESMATRRGNLS